MNAPAIRVLLTEDVAADAELEVRELKRAGLRIAYRIVESAESFEQALREFAPDVILSDFSMPNFDGMAALAIARERAPDTPFIFVSGTIGEEYAIRALKNGATDYVVKSNLVRLPAAVERAVQESKERVALRAAERARLESESHLRLLADNVPAMIAYTDREHRIQYANQQYVEFYGGRPQSILGKTIAEFIGAERWQTVRPHIERVLAGETVRYDAVRHDAQGTKRSVEATLIPNVDDAGHVLGVYTFLLDVTERREREEKIARLSRMRDVVGALNAAIVRVRDRRALLGEFCRIAVAQGGFVLARYVEVGVDGRLAIVANTEADSSLFQRMVDDYNRDPARAESLLAAALRTGKPVISDDIASDPRVRNRAELTRDGNYALALLPTLVEGKLAGVAVLRSRESGVFDDEEMRLIFEMISNLSFALELLAKQDQLAYLALYDSLTGLPNRAHFQDRLGQAAEAARRAGAPLGLALIDLERFKSINDAMGQAVGDRVLKAIAARLLEAAGDPGRVARLGSNLFALSFADIQSAEEVARSIEEKAATVIAQPLDVDGTEVRVAAKAGIAVFPEDGADADTLLRNAEAALKRAKETGERYVFYAPHINARVSEQVDLEHRLRKAVENGELFLHFQPKLDLSTRRIIGLEALLRWTGPDRVFVSPAKFVPVLEQTGLILEAGRQAFERASATYRDWKARGLNPPRIAVNVSALQLRRKSFVEDVQGAVGKSDGVDIEITESLLMQEVDESIRKLRALRDWGMHIALDDFGTGHSSLAYLSKLPLDTLKIDRSFIFGMTEKADDTSIVSIIISLAQALRLKVVAEGVETEAQAQMLRLLRCDQVQGYLFSPPLPAERVEALLKSL